MLTSLQMHIALSSGTPAKIGKNHQTSRASLSQRTDLSGSIHIREYTPEYGLSFKTKSVSIAQFVAKRQAGKVSSVSTFAPNAARLWLVCMIFRKSHFSLQFGVTGVSYGVWGKAAVFLYKIGPNRARMIHTLFGH